jgi:hypothetical protein
VAVAAGATTTRAEILASVAAASTAELAGRLLVEFEELTRRFHLGDFRPSELSGGRFGEAAFRICEHVCFGTSTSLDKMLPKTDDLVRNLENTPGTRADPTYRIHIPRTLRLIYDLRNKRDVAHLGAGVSPNFSDASLILGTASWVVAEIVRLSHICDIATAQEIVDGLVQRRVPLIWTEGGIVRVLKPTLDFDEKALVILYHFHPEWVDVGDLVKWVEHSHVTKFRDRVLRPLHDSAKVQLADGRCKILPPGLKFVEETPKLRQI